MLFDGSGVPSSVLSALYFFLAFLSDNCMVRKLHASLLCWCLPCFRHDFQYPALTHRALSIEVAALSWGFGSGTFFFLCPAWFGNFLPIPRLSFYPSLGLIPFFLFRQGYACAQQLRCCCQCTWTGNVQWASDGPWQATSICLDSAPHGTSRYVSLL